MNQDTNHIIAINGGSELQFRHCGESYKPQMPSPVSIYLAITNEFINLHANCQPRDAGRPDIAGHEIPDAEGKAHG